MLRRDQFLTTIDDNNNLSFLKKQADELESFVDKELSRKNNIIRFLNKDGLNQSGYIEKVKDTRHIHSNDNISGENGKIFSPLTNEYHAIWVDGGLTDLDDQDASSQPWLNKILTREIDSVIVVDLPSNTNRNVARILADRYLDKGQWGNIPNTGTSGTTDYPQAVKVYYNFDKDLLQMEFRLNPGTNGLG